MATQPFSDEAMRGLPPLDPGWTYAWDDDKWVARELAAFFHFPESITAELSTPSGEPARVRVREYELPKAWSQVVITADAVTMTVLPVKAKVAAEPRQRPRKPKLQKQQDAMQLRSDAALPPSKQVRYSKKQAAALLDMSVSSLEYRARAGEITIKKDGGRRYVTQAEIDRYNKCDHTALIRPATPKAGS